MGKICRVPGCTSNFGDSKAKNPKLKAKNNLKYAGRNQVNSFGFPSKSSSEEERMRWIRAIPKLTVQAVDEMKDPYICEKHWPEGYEKIKTRNGKFRPAHPPSVFEGFKISELPTPPPKPRPTKRSSFEVRTRQEDQFPAFIDIDQLTFEKLCSDVSTREFCTPIVSFVSGNALWIQSTEFASGIPSFILKVFKDLTFEAFHAGVRCFVSTLAKIRVTRVDKWSRVEEAIRFLRNGEMTPEMAQHKKVTKEQVDCMNAHKVGEKTYSIGFVSILVMSVTIVDFFWMMRVQRLSLIHI